MKKILAVDDNRFDRRVLESMLENAQLYQVQTADCGQSALVQADQSPPDAVLLDLRLPDMDGLEVLKRLKQCRASLPVIVLSGFADIRTAVEAIHMGAQDYLTKPFESHQLLPALRHALEKNDLSAGTGKFGPNPEKRGPSLARVEGKSPAIQEVARQIRKVAGSNLTVLIQGETGTGKEPAARALHEESPYRGGPFMAVDCGALPENLLESELFGHERGAFSGADRKKLGQFELAEGGTLFLDEIGNMPLPLQAKLLRALQERQVRPVGAAKAFPVKVRVVAASNTALETAAKSGQFRQDLYYRLAEFTLQLPPLRDRREDILPLAHRFREEACVEFQKSVTAFSEPTAALLQAHPWPGNIRELRNVIRQAVLLSPDSTLPEGQIRALLETERRQEPPGPALVPALPGTSLRKIVEKAAEETERRTILDVLRFTRGNKSQAAKALQVDYKTLRLKIKKYGFQVSDLDLRRLE